MHLQCRSLAYSTETYNPHSCDFNNSKLTAIVDSLNQQKQQQRQFTQFHLSSSNKQQLILSNRPCRTQRYSIFNCEEYGNIQQQAWHKQMSAILKRSYTILKLAINLLKGEKLLSQLWLINRILNALAVQIPRLQHSSDLNNSNLTAMVDSLNQQKQQRRQFTVSLSQTTNSQASGDTQQQTIAYTR